MVSIKAGVFTDKEVREIAMLCNAVCPSVAERGAATDLEKWIIQGDFAGSVVVPAMPDLFNMVFSSDQMVAFHCYLRHHVEGELYAILPSTARLSDVVLTTNRIDYQIQESMAFHADGCQHV